MASDTGPTESRRDRQSREMTAEIIDLARGQLESGGRAAVSWRGIARQVGMNPASLYTYFDSLDDLFTAVILDSYGGLAAALEDAFAAETSTDRLVSVTRAYRRWAVEHPAQFNLIFSDQIAGYAAPPGGPTVDAELAVVRPLVRAIGERVGRPYDIDTFGDLPQPEQDRLIGFWGLLHGLVTLEINSHLPFVEDHDALLVGQVTSAVAVLAAIER